MKTDPANESGDRGRPGRGTARRVARWVRPAGLLAVILGLALVAPTFISATGLGRPPALAVETLPPPGAPSSYTAGYLHDALPTLAPDGPVDGVDFDLIVPSLGYRETVLEGTTTAILDRAPGHYVTTAWPGTVGNVGVAAHNTYWLNAGFVRVKAGDILQIRTRQALFTYEIRDIRVVNPDDRTVLAPTADHRLTLTTCYPLWAGAWATQRLIFTAFQTSFEIHGEG